MKLNGPLVAGGDVDTLGLQFSPDSSRVLYYADQDTDNVNEIYSVPAGGGTPTKLNGSLVAGGNVYSSGLQFSPDSSRVLYYADQDTDTVNEIYSVPSAGGAATKLNGPLVAGGNVDSLGLQFSPDSSRVLYLADQDTDNVNEIYSVPAGGGTPTKLNGSLVAGGNVFSSGLQFSPDSSRVLYLADQMTDTVNEIFSVPSAGGTSVKLNGPLPISGDVSSLGLQFSPDSTRVLYHADQDTNNDYELYIVPAGGGTPIKLNGPLVAGGDVSTDNLQFSPDGSRVLYLADQDTDNVNEIYSVRYYGGPPTKLNSALVAGGDVVFQQFSPDSSRVLYLADQDTDDVFEIYIVPAGGGTPIKLNGPLVAGGDVLSTGLQFSPDGSRVLYLADQDTDGVNEAYVRIVGDRANAGGGGWDTAASWDQAVTPDEVMQVFIDTPSTVTATGSATPRIVNELAVGGGTGTSTLALEAGAVITATHGVSIYDGGVLRGDGRVEAKLTILSGGEIRSGGGDQLQIGGATLSNSGRIEAIGTSTAPAEIEFDGAVKNEEADGEIFARNALLRFDGGLENQASLSLSFGTSDVFGDVYNVDTGTIIVSGNSNVTFYDDVINDGELRTSAGTAAVFFGDVSGPGTYTGTGTVFFEGMFSPGSSPAAVSFSGDVVLGSEAVLAIELGGTTLGAYDQMLVSGDLVLDGELGVSILPSLTPAAGQSFNILDWGSAPARSRRSICPHLPAWPGTPRSSTPTASSASLPQASPATTTKTAPSTPPTTPSGAML